MIAAHALGKDYGSVRAVHDVTFEIRAGEAFGLLGPNGAGKTTTLHMLTGVVESDRGSVTLEERGSPSDPELRRMIGVAPQELAVYEELSAEENLRFFGRLYGLEGWRLRERVDWALEFARLQDRRKDRTAKYSGGMKRRLNLACALVHDPRVLFCDEPTVGVDPQSRHHIFESIEGLRAEGCTLVYTTHYMEEAQRLCDRIAIMDQGRILALDDVQELIARHGGASRVEAELISDPGDELSDLDCEVQGRHLSLETERPFDAVARLGRSGLEIANLRVERPDLERVFLNLTGRKLRD